MTDKLKTLRQLWEENGKKPFKAEKVLETNVDGTNNLPTGSTFQVIEECPEHEGNLSGVLYDKEDVEIRKSMRAKLPVWRQI